MRGVRRAAELDRTGRGRATAVASVRATSRSCSAAAPAAPRAGMRRVFTSPGTGALAKTRTRVVNRSRSGAGARARRRGSSASRSHHMSTIVRTTPARLPAPARRDDALAQAERRRYALQPLAQRDVLHQRERRKPARRREGRARHEHRLVAGRDAGEPRAAVHAASATSAQQRMPAFDPHVEAPPARAGCGEPVECRAVGARREARVGVQEEQHVARRDVGAGVHLARAAARRGEDAVGERPRRVRRAVAAAAVDDDDLVAARRGAAAARRASRRCRRPRRASGR